jgi:hypothetical protein
MEDVRFSTTALYTANFTPPCPTLIAAPTTVGLWNLNTGSGTTAIDASVSGFNGAIVGATWSSDTICNICSCRANVTTASTTAITADGNQSIVLNINTMGEPVTSICIDLPNYISLVEPSCLKCDLANLTSNGTILNGAVISGVSGILEDPYGLGHSRKICYEFATPTVVNQTVQLNLKFPPVLNLSCCENSVNFCLDVTLRKDDCTSCEYNICHTSHNAKESLIPQTIKKTKEESLQLGNNNPTNSSIDEFKLLVFPNPARESINVEVKDINFSEGVVELMTKEGKIISSKQIKSNRFNVDLNSVSSGAYILTVKVANKKSTKIIIVE